MTRAKKQRKSGRRAIRTHAETIENSGPGADPKRSKRAQGSAQPMGAPADEDPNSKPGFASPPCFMHELDPSYLGYMTEAEVLALLNELLEAERAGARGVGAMCNSAEKSRDRAVLHEIAKDEARFCAMLSHHVARFGGARNTATGRFYEKLMALESRTERLDLLDRGQRWVVKKLQEALPRIGDEALYRDLQDMLATHEINVARGAELMGS